MNAIENRIQELRNLQNQEEAANFPNGDLWNELENKIYFLQTYGQENEPAMIFCIVSGAWSGIVLDNGQEVFFEGMNYENVAF